MRVALPSGTAPWWWLLPLNGFLLSPVLFYELRFRDGGLDGAALFVLVSSVLWLLFVQTLARRIWITHLLLLPFYLLAATDLFLVLHYDTRLGSSMLLVLFDNREDAADYLRAHATGILCLLLPILFLHGLAVWSIRHLRVRAPGQVTIVTGLLLVAVYTTAKFRTGPWECLAGHDRSSPFGVLAQSYVAYRVFDSSLRHAERSKSFRFGAQRTEVPNEPEAYVLVIGESARPDHYGVYGYARNTTPRLGKMSRLIVFEDVVSQSSLTKESVPLILTRGVIENPSRTAHERSLVSAFSEVGFGTYWLSTHQRDTFTGAINRYSSEADVQLFFERRHDDVLIERAAEILADPKANRVLLILHMLGSHFEYASRYPRAFDVFGAQRGSTPERSVNAYDNSIRYTDHLLGKLIDLLEKRAGVKGLMFVSDHGENLRDDERGLLGHMFSNEYDLPVPMLAWYSEEYEARHPERVANADLHDQRPLNSRAVFHSMLDMAGIQIGDPETARLSVFSAEHVPVRRMVARDRGVEDFDVWLASHRMHGARITRKQNVGRRVEAPLP